MDLEELAAVIELLDKTDFTDFRFEQGDLRIAVSRSGSAVDVPPPDRQTGAAEQTDSGSTADASQQLPVENAASTTAPAGQPGVLGADEVLVKAPMLGTFYRSPKPGEPSFAEVGDKVEADATVCIIEVMKLMNSVPSGVAGEITRVFVSSGETVEFDQPLFAVRAIA